MRIIAGKVKGRKLFEVPGKNTRSLTDRAKESLFSILTPRIPEAKVLDLYSGCGSFALEAISRGALKAHAVDTFGPAVEANRKNIEKMGFESEIILSRANVVSYCKSLVRNEEKFDIVFADPPFPDLNQPKSAFFSMVESIPNLLEMDGVFIVRVHNRADNPEIPGTEMYREHKVGLSKLLFYKLSEVVK